MKQLLRLLLLSVLPLLASLPARAEFTVDGVKYDIISITDLTAKVTGADFTVSTDITIPSTISYNGKTLAVKSVANSAFALSPITSLTVEPGLTTLGYQMCYMCYSLLNVTLGDSITTIGKEAFAYCSSLESINIPGSVTDLGQESLNFCSSLKSLVLEDGVGVLNGYNSWMIDFRQWKLESAYIGRDLSYSSLLYGMNRLTTVTFGPTVTYIPRLICQGCTSLETVAIPDNVTAIYEGAFRNCTALDSISIGCGVDTIGANAFNGCKNVRGMEISTLTPPACADINSFDNQMYVDTHLWVGDEAYEAFLTAPVWSNFFTVTGADEIANDASEMRVSGGVISGLSGVTEVFDTQGRVVYRGTGESVDLSGRRGIYLVRNNGKTTKVAVR